MAIGRPETDSQPDYSVSVQYLSARRMNAELELAGGLTSAMQRDAKGGEKQTHVPERQDNFSVSLNDDVEPDESHSLLERGKSDAEAGTSGMRGSSLAEFCRVRRYYASLGLAKFLRPKYNFCYGLMLQEMGVQGRLAGPMAVSFTMIGLTGNITLSFAGHYGMQELAAVALSGSLTFMFGRLPMIGMSCALDTMASQAFGAGHVDSLALIFQRTVAFLATHCVGLTALVAGMPLLLRALGWEAELCANIFKYTLALLPTIWLDVLNRPMNRILVAQKITTPQACIGCTVTLLHAALNWLFVRILGWGFLSLAFVAILSSLTTFLLTAGYILTCGRQYCTWGQGPSLAAFKEWKLFAKIAYPACFMECAEAWCWGSTSLLAGLLPNPARSVTAHSIALSLLSSMFFIYLSQGLACSTRVGNSLGAGDASAARLAVLAASGWVPIIWIFSTVLFTEPHIRGLVIWLFTDGADADLVWHVQTLLHMMILLNLADGLQCVLTGAIQGAGRQAIGLRVNLVAFYLVGIPVAYTLAFPLRAGIEGLFCGLILGAATQAVAFVIYITKLDWGQEARNAALRVQSLQAPIKPIDAE